VMLINENSNEITIKAITGFSKNAAYKLRKKYQEKGLPSQGLRI